MTILVCLPVISLILSAIVFAGQSTKAAGPEPDWTRIVIWSAAYNGFWLVLGSELLSHYGVLNTVGVALVWLASILALAAFTLRNHILGAGIQYWRRLLQGLRAWPKKQRFLLAFLIAEILFLLAVAIAAAPNTADSLLYHMSRVAHWQQNQSLDHYAAVYNHQLWSPLFSELSILHLMSLWGSDRLANVVQFASMVGSLILVAGIVRKLGGDRTAQLLASLFAFTAPMAILQATSTQTDYVVGYWSLATLYLLIHLIKNEMLPPDWLALGAVVGLGMLTKVTYYPFLGLLLLGSFALAWRHGHPLRALLQWGITVGFIAIVINLGFWSRNLQTYGTPLGAGDMLASNTNLSLDPRTPLSNGLQHLALNFTTPWPSVNDSLVNRVKQVSRALGQSSQQFEILWGWNHEDLAGNPLHILLLLTAIVLALLPVTKDRQLKLYAAALIISLLGFAWAVDAGVHRVRYQVPWILMGAPLSATIFMKHFGRRVFLLTSGGLLILALPWIFLNQTRPIIGWQPRTRTASVFTIDRATSLFANAPRARQPFSQATQTALAGSCQRVGLSIDAIDIEYAFWWLLRQQDPKVEIRVVRPLPELAHLLITTFDPCAVICTNCSATPLDGFQLEASFGPIDLCRGD